MTDYEVFIDLLDKNDIFHHESDIYGTDEPYERGLAVWLNVGHVEFTANGELINVVNY